MVFPFVTEKQRKNKSGKRKLRNYEVTHMGEDRIQTANMQGGE
jgi:hypothetical protein